MVVVNDQTYSSLSLCRGRDIATYISSSVVLTLLVLKKQLHIQFFQYI